MHRSTTRPSPTSTSATILLALLVARPGWNVFRSPVSPISRCSKCAALWEALKQIEEWLKAKAVAEADESEKRPKSKTVENQNHEYVNIIWSIIIQHDSYTIISLNWRRPSSNCVSSASWISILCTMFAQLCCTSICDSLCGCGGIRLLDCGVHLRLRRLSVQSFLS